MSLKEFPKITQRSEEWYDQRRGMVTASIVSALLTTRAYGPMDYACPSCEAPAQENCRSKVKRGGEVGTPIKTAHPERVDHAHRRRDTSPLIIEPSDKATTREITAMLVGERISGNTDPSYEGFHMLRGIEDEPIARAAYAAHYAPVRETGFLVRDDWGFDIGFSPDGLVDEDDEGEGFIEIKSRIQKKHVLTVLADEVPTENMAQIQTGLLVSGRAWSDYISFCGGMALWRKRVYPDQRWFKAIVAAVAAFEKRADEMSTAYLTRTAGLPMTERTIYNDGEMEFS